MQRHRLADQGSTKNLFNRRESTPKNVCAEIQITRGGARDRPKTALKQTNALEKDY